MLSRILSYQALALATALLALAWFFADAAPEQADPAAPDATATPAERSAWPTARTTRSPLAGTQSPFAPFLSAAPAAPAPAATLPLTLPVPLTASDEANKRHQFEQGLRAYRVGTLSSEEKSRIKKNLYELKRDPLARAYIIDTFFSSNQPQLAQTLYQLIQDARLKDVSLVEGLIQRESTTPTDSAKVRIVDLIADLGTRSDATYSAQIDGYLAQLASNPDPQLRNAAISQRIWYLNQHQPWNIALQEQYLSHSAPTVREEVYSLIEARIASQTLAGQAQLAAALNAALRADLPGMSGEERARASALLQTLTGRAAAL